MYYLHLQMQIQLPFGRGHMTLNPNEKGQQNKKKNNDLQNTTQKTKNRVTRTPLKTRVNSCVPEGLAVPASHVTTFEI